MPFFDLTNQQSDTGTESILQYFMTYYVETLMNSGQTILETLLALHRLRQPLAERVYCILPTMPEFRKAKDLTPFDFKETTLFCRNNILCAFMQK